MAISHGQPLLLLLLVSLFFVPAAFGSSRVFRPCNITHPYPVSVRTVDISPHPVDRSGNSNITIAGYAGIQIPDGATVVVNVSAPFLVNPYVSIKTYPICDITECRVTVRLFSRFAFTVPNAFIPEELNGLLNIVTLSIKVEQEKIMCVVFNCVVTGRRST
ncbi:unnamed protein product [Brassica napus]|uniref:(rape) hypothetical protein n=1 Tax=Brassica napus TaxID=3708 RepID=A0A816VWQ9_BRANA|nr:unnamed protein product [Brassica napus]